MEELIRLRAKRIEIESEIVKLLVNDNFNVVEFIKLKKDLLKTKNDIVLFIRNNIIIIKK